MADTKAKPKHGGARKGAGRKKGIPDKATRQQHRSLADMAKEYAPGALATLAEIAQRGESESARVSATKELLDRAYGRAPQAVEHTGDIEIRIVTSVPRANA